MSTHGPMPRSAWIFPALAVLLFAVATALHYSFAPSAAGIVFAAVLLVILFGTVFAAVHHAEVIAERIGEPFGTLLLTLSVTIIEVALIATITLIEPSYTATTPGPIYSWGQLGFVSVVTILLYGVFLYTQTIRHRDYFVIDSSGGSDGSRASNRIMLLSTLLLLVSLLAVVLLAKKFSLVVDAGTALIGAPPAFAGILVALLILLPESVAAVNAARKNDLQKSINLALGSSLATIGLTIPAVAVAAYALDKQLVLGLPTLDVVLLVLTFLVSMLTLGTGRTNILFGLVHLVVFAVFVFLVFIP